MYKFVLRAIEGIEIFPVISLAIFFTFFVGMTWYVLKMNKSHLDKMENMPLD